MSLMGVDIGTTGVKAVLFDSAGSVMASAYREYPSVFPSPGACELDSSQVMRASFEVIAEVARKAPAGDPVQGIGTASQGESFTSLDQNGNIISNSISFSDSRPEPYVKPWSEAFGIEKLYRITGHTAYPMYSLYKFLWVKDNKPEQWERSSKFLFYSDLLAYMLTGECVTDYTLASRTMFFDVGKKQWSKEIMDLLGLPEEKMPTVAPSGTVQGKVKQEVARELGLGSDVQVAVSGHDQIAGALGCGAASAGFAAYSLGTSEAISPAIPDFILSPELMAGNLPTYPHVIPNLYTTVAFTMTGGSVLRWVRDQFATSETAEAKANGQDPYDLIIAAASREPADLVMLPHFGPTGTPHFDATGAGLLFGMNLSTTRAEALRAFIDGITYDMKWNLSILADAGFSIDELRVIGGGAKSAELLQMKADVLGIPLTTMSVRESTCLGAALVLGHGMGLFDMQEQAAKWAKPERTFTPNPTVFAKHEDRFVVFKELYNSLGKARQLMHGITRGR